MIINQLHKIEKKANETNRHSTVLIHCIVWYKNKFMKTGFHRRYSFMYNWTNYRNVLTFIQIINVSENN